MRELLGGTLNHWTDDHIDRLGEILSAARNLIDLELSEEIPESIRPEWNELANKLNALTRGNPTPTKSVLDGSKDCGGNR